jgi:hypothetical protein
MKMETTTEASSGHDRALQASMKANAMIVLMTAAAPHEVDGDRAKAVQP